jgi:hypothetical protein
MTWVILGWTLYAVFVVTISIPLIAIGLHLWDEHQRKRLQRFNQLTRYRPDENGNYEIYFNPMTDTSFEPEPGNTVALPPVFVNGLPPTELQQVSGKKKGHLVSFKDKGEYKSLSWSGEPDPDYTVQEVKPVNESLPLQEGDLPALQAGKFTNYVPELKEGILRGEGKSALLTRLGLLGRNYRDACRVYESLYLQLTKRED